LKKRRNKKKYTLLSREERINLLMKKMQEKGIEVGSGVPGKKYDSQEIYELIDIVKLFPRIKR
tara:strand:+ start:131 stop:319 length:189 start_codon:yes stop_codon:yes gene_type:complete